MRAFYLATIAATPESIPTLSPSGTWNGTAGTGFSSTPTDPTRTTAKPIVRLIDVERQTITDELTVSVMAAANNGGTLFNNMGIEYVDFHFEGTTQRVSALSLRTFTRFDGSTYKLPCFSVTLKKPSGTEGLANLYVTAKPLDATMQSRVIGPHPFLLYDSEHDFDVTVRADGAGDYTTLSAAMSYLRTQSAIRPRIQITQAGTYDLGSAGGVYVGAGYCTIEATAAVTIAQDPPALVFDFTRMRPSYDRLRFKGPNLTVDFVETLEFYTEVDGQLNWFDGCNVAQSRGRDDLWRKRSRNIVPALIRFGAYFTECNITDVNDWGDKTPLARGNRSNATWADAFDDGLCMVGNVLEDHSSAVYYENVPALRIRYTGAASTATVSLSGGNGSNNRTFTLKENGTSVGTFNIQNTEDAFRADTNYTVQNVADFINGVADWTATVLDNTRYAAVLSFPNTTNGAGFTDLDAKTADLDLPTHFDIHSDIYQLPNLASPRQNVIFAFNQGFGIDAQVVFTGGVNGMQDALFVGNAFYNNLGTLDEGLQTQLANTQSHVVYVHNSMPTQRVTMRTDASYNPDAYCLVANNATLYVSDAGGGGNSTVTVKDNHINAGETAFPGSTGTTIGGDETTLYADAINGDFTPAGDLLTNLASPVLPFDIAGQSFPASAPKGARAA